MKQMIKTSLKGTGVQIAVLISCIFLSSFFSTYPVKVVEDLINACVEQKGIRVILLIGGAYLLFEILQAVFNMLTSLFSEKLEIQISHNMRTGIFGKLERLPMSFFATTDSSDLMFRMMQDASVSASGILQSIILLTQNLIMFGMGFYFMWSIDWRITIVMIPIGIMMILVSSKSGRVTERLTEAQRTAMEKMWGKFNESIRGIKEIKSFSKEKEFYGRIAEVSENTNKKTYRLKKFILSVECLYSMMFMGVIALIMIYGGYQVSVGMLSIGGLSALMMYNGMLTDPMLNFFNIYQDIRQIMVSVKKIQEIMDKPEEDYGENLPRYSEFSRGICFQDVSFRYGKEPVLQKINLNIQKGQKVALIGTSGSGKSTLCSLLMRFYIPQEGKIMLDDRELDEIPLSDLRRICGIVFQDISLWSGTVLENIRLGNPTASEEETERVIRIAGLQSVLEKLPNGLQTQVGEGGTQLSGGERQRVSIAKTLLSNPEILMLDESMSALDPVNTMQITENILQEYPQKTIVFTAHKLIGLVERCDKIVYLEKGEICAEGSHKELMEKESVYRDFYNAQFGKEELSV